MRWMIYFLLGLSPLPLASARPVWQWLWVSLIGVLFLAQFVISRKRGNAQLPSPLGVSAAMVLAFVGWGFAQAFLPIGSSLALAIPSVDASLERLAAISVSPSRTIAVSSFFLAHVLFAYLVFGFVDRRDRGVQLVRFCGIVGLIYAAYGFTVFVSGNETVLWYEKWTGYESLTSSFVNRNSYAAYAGLGLQCLIAYFFYWAQAELAENRTGRELYRHLLETMLQKAWWLPIAILLTATAVILTNSRAGFVSVALGVFVLFLLSPNRYQRSANWVKRVFGYGTVMALAAGLFYFSGQTLDARLQTDSSADKRFINYPYVVEAIEDRPVLGYGLGAFDHVHLTYRAPDDPGWFSRAHSDFLELAHTAGIPAAVWFLIALGIALIFLVRRLVFGLQYRAFIALGITTSLQLAIHSTVDFSLQMPAVSYLWVAILAVSLAIAHRCELAQKRDNPGLG